MQATISASPACTARAARRSAITPEAPPVGMWSSQRGLTPRCWVTPTAVSGREREAADGEAVDPLLGDARARDQRLQGLADEPVRAVGRVAPVGHRHRHGDGDALVRRARHVRRRRRRPSGRRRGAGRRGGGSPRLQDGRRRDPGDAAERARVRAGETPERVSPPAPLSVPAPVSSPARREITLRSSGCRARKPRPGRRPLRSASAGASASACRGTAALPGRRLASSRSSPRCTFCDEVSGKASTKAT